MDAVKMKYLAQILTACVALKLKQWNTCIWDMVTQMKVLKKLKQFISQWNSSLLMKLQTCCGTKNGNLAKSIFEVNIMMRVKDPQKLEFYKKCLQQEYYDSLNNSIFQ